MQIFYRMLPSLLLSSILSGAGIISHMTASLQNEMHCWNSCSYLFVNCVFCTCQSTWMQWLQGSTLHSCILLFAWEPSIALKPSYCSTWTSEAFASVLWEVDRTVWWEVTHFKSDKAAMSLPRVPLPPAQPHAAAVKKPVVSASEGPPGLSFRAHINFTLLGM